MPRDQICLTLSYRLTIKYNQWLKFREQASEKARRDTSLITDFKYLTEPCEKWKQHRWEMNDMQW